MADVDRPDLLLRYQPAERVNHWLVVVLFVCAGASGLALFHPALFWLSGVLGGGPWSVVLHPFVGIAMCVAFYLLGRPLWRHNRLEPRDRAWLRGIRDVLDNREDRLPEVGRYNAGQKLLFFLLAGCLAALLVSGVVIWRAYFAGYFPIGLIRLSALLHAIAAFLLVFGVIVHIAAALWVKGSVGAMTGGTVTLGWAFKHHRAWFREMTRPAAGR
ncbi:MAG TPA: formate dehydrogenase subunit gamma [Steroidobacteraceae bacterium]|nr:formate dehydrogenase subunit gamma [Steroidobacteraceae bacterium]